jgi:hypothetical protein
MYKMKKNLKSSRFKTRYNMCGRFATSIFIKHSFCT